MRDSWHILAAIRELHTQVLELKEAVAKLPTEHPPMISLNMTMPSLPSREEDDEESDSTGSAQSAP
jgi:hypothetical protein